MLFFLGLIFFFIIFFLILSSNIYFFLKKIRPSDFIYVELF